MKNNETDENCLCLFVFQFVCFENKRKRREKLIGVNLTVNYNNYLYATQTSAHLLILEPMMMMMMVNKEIFPIVFVHHHKRKFFLFNNFSFFVVLLIKFEIYICIRQDCTNNESSERERGGEGGRQKEFLYIHV